jgi:formiminotetrahydrofolate cyclodeaminase
MVAGLSRKKKSHVAYVEELSAALEELRRTARSLTEAIDADASSHMRIFSFATMVSAQAQNCMRSYGHVICFT